MGRIVFHTGAELAHGHYEEALELYRGITAQPESPMGDVIARLEDMSFPWGVSDGN